MLINFDNAATTFPKPLCVRKAVAEAMENFGGNAGRGGHPLAMRTSAALYSARETAAGFFGASPENVIFTMNCTYAINMAIQGIMSGGGHMIISGIEHNSAARPAAALAAKGCITLSVAPVYADDELTAETFRSLMREDTKAVVCTLAGNVTGQIPPWKRIAALCRERDICFIADGAQACGILDIKMSDGINILCTAGHKGLYGITGTGLLITDGRYPLTPLIQGGTGSSSLSLVQPGLLPESLESGTPCIIGAMSVKAGIDFIQKQNISRIRYHEENLCSRFISRLKGIHGAVIYRESGAAYAPVVSFNIGDIPPELLAADLAEKGFCLRAGFHCAALAHTQLGTPNGTIRFSPAFFNTEHDVDALANSIKYVLDSEKYQKNY
ncbi:MAG: aminotransferase class V-fold PLP-dependent enzyme [Ruminococcus sp.]|nr:aminotransferase class V-fold PLP-dependent enzyme [Ruminococcus sp.]